MTERGKFYENNPYSAFDEWIDSVEVDGQVVRELIHKSGRLESAQIGFIRGWQARQPEIDALKDKCNELALACSLAVGAAKQAQAEVEELREDAERIDLLCQPGMELVIDPDPEPKNDSPFVVFRVGGCRNDREWEEIGRGETVREAIDAAMKETK